MKLPRLPEDCFSNTDLAHYMLGIFLRNKPEHVKCEHFEMRFEFNELVPNTTVAPQNGDRNWAKNTTKPLGYPGWIGYINFEITDELPKRFPSYFKDSLIHPIVVCNPRIWQPSDLDQTWQTCFFLDDWKHLELAAGLTNNKLEGFHGYFDSNHEYWETLDPF